MPPTKARPKKFERFTVLYNYNGFAIAWGWGKFDKDNKDNKETSKRLAMRWNGKRNEVGYPHQGKYPTWFMLPDELSIPLILSIPTINALNNVKSAKRLLKVIKQLKLSAQKS
jgi:hypothetical protein